MGFRVASVNLGAWYFYVPGLSGDDVDRLGDVVRCIILGAAATRRAGLLQPQDLWVRTWGAAVDPSARVAMQAAHFSLAVPDDLAPAMRRHVETSNMSARQVYPGEILVSGDTELVNEFGDTEVVADACSLTLIHDGRDMTLELGTYTDAWLNVALSGRLQDVLAARNRPRLRAGLHYLADALKTDIDPGPATDYAQPTVEGLDNHYYEFGVLLPDNEPPYRPG